MKAKFLKKLLAALLLALLAALPAAAAEKRFHILMINDPHSYILPYREAVTEADGRQSVAYTGGMARALELVRAAHERGWKVGVVSGGFHEVADRIVETAGIDYCLANRLEVQGGKLTGKLAAEIVTRERKLDVLRSWAHELGLPLSQTVAMGDGANDIPMIQAAGTGIAFCAKPKTRETAPFAINERNLMLAMDIILRD